MNKQQFKEAAEIVHDCLQCDKAVCLETQRILKERESVKDAPRAVDREVDQA